MYNEFQLMEIQKDNRIRAIKHIVDNSGYEHIRDNNYNLGKALDRLIIETRQYYSDMYMKDARFLVSHEVLEHIKNIFGARIEFGVRIDSKTPFSTYRGIEIIPLDYLDDEIILLSKDAFAENIDNYFNIDPDKRYDIYFRLPTIINPKLIAVSRNQKVLISKMTTKELRVEASLHRSDSKYNYGLILEELRKRRNNNGL